MTDTFGFHFVRHWPHKGSRCPECGVKQGDISPDIQPVGLSERIAELLVENKRLTAGWDEARELLAGARNDLHQTQGSLADASNVDDTLRGRVERLTEELDEALRLVEVKHGMWQREFNAHSETQVREAQAQAHVERLEGLLREALLTEFVADDNGIVCLQYNEQGGLGLRIAQALDAKPTEHHSDACNAGVEMCNCEPWPEDEQAERGRDCQCLNRNDGPKLGKWHTDPDGWTCDVCDGFVPWSWVRPSEQAEGGRG